MSAVVGVLVDVSASMKQSIGGPVNQEGGSWARSIFRVVDELIKQDVSSDNQVFTIGYGASLQPNIFDLLNTVEKNEKTYQGNTESGSKRAMLVRILDLLERNGAPYVRRWATMDVLLGTLADNEIELFLQMIERDRGFQEQFVEKCLPDECKYESLTSQATVVAQNTSWVWGLLAPSLKRDMDTRIRRASVESIREAIDKGLLLAWKNNVVEVGRHAIIGLDKASQILHGCIEEDKLTDEQVDKLMRTVEPFIYGRTPMMTALNKARELLAYPDFDEMQKVLFVLSDGEPTDGDNSPVFEDVNVVSCYITNSSISNPKRLYCTETQSWDDGAKFMFKLSSNIQTQHLPRTIFVKRGWKVDITNNQTKLFLQVNHPDLLDEVCSFAKDVVCSQDALSDILASVNLDLYINKANDEFGAKKQKGGTCYANASAAVMHLAMKRIVGREGGYPNFFALRQELIDTYGIHGADTLRVLQEVCPRYRLHCKRTDIHGALKAIAEKRPVLARFGLTREEWHLFYKFYEHNPTGILTDKELDIQKRPHDAEIVGHAVVLTSFNSEGLNLMNSQGTEWANNGFFSVKNPKILGMKFIDVYWELSDLLKSEIESYDLEGPRIAGNLLKSLKGLNTATFKCPLCDKVSEVSKFRGKLVNAMCPSCHGVFDTKKEDCHDLILNMYLTSLCREKDGSGSAEDESL